MTSTQTSQLGGRAVHRFMDVSLRVDTHSLQSGPTHKFWVDLSWEDLLLKTTWLIN